MGTESELSSSASDRDDSDTIVISSKSRILISPRKKGSKAVSKLLGSAADDVIEQLLRGSGADGGVVTKSKSSTVRVGHTQFSSKEHVPKSDRSTGTTKPTKDNGRSVTKKTYTTNNREAQVHGMATQNSPKEKQAYTRSGRENSSGRDEEHEDESEESDLASELSAPSSISDDEYGTHDVRQTHVRSNTTRSRPRTSGRATKRVESTRIQRRNEVNDDDRSDSDVIQSGAESDTSSMTKDSSRSQVEVPSQRSRAQGKFDDQLAVASFHPSTKATRSAMKTATPTERIKRTDSTRNRVSHRSRDDRTDLDDSVILPTTATKEMEDLKQTLKKLAHQDPVLSSSSHTKHATFILSDVPQKAAPFSTSKNHHSGQLRREESVGSMATGHTEAAWAATTALSHFDSSTKNTSYRMKSRQRDPESSDSGFDSDHEETSVSRRLFSTPPSHSSKMSTPPTAPASSFTSRRTPSPQQSTSFHSNSGYTSVLDTSLTASAPSSAQGSRAVLSALKALQDKIRRLEEEREKLLQELSDVKVKARKREAEIASTEKKFAYELGQTKESARAAYDAIRSEKEELKLELVKHEERRKAMDAELQHAHRLTSTYSAKADDLQSQLQLSESQRKSIDTELDATRGAHKQEVRDLKGDLTSLQKERDTLQDQVKMLQVQFERESQHHAETRERLHESEQTIGGISQLNEKLVAKVWEANEIATKATKKSKKLLQSQRVSTLSRPTAASRAASISAANNGAATPLRSGSTNTKKTRTGSVTSKRAGSVSQEKRPSQVAASNNLELLRAANLGRNIPFSLGTSASRSHSILSNVQEAIRQCDTSYARPVTNPPPTPQFPKAKKAAASTRKLSSVLGEQEHYSSRPSTTASILGVPHPSTLVGSRARERSLKGESHQVTMSASANRPSSIRVPTPSTSYENPMQSQIMDDLEAAVHSAEKEFGALNQKYKDTVAIVERGRDGASQASTQLGTMLDELEAKGKQLNLLKQVYEQASRSTINPIRHIVHSPEAVRRKTASLRILSDYRQMERDAKSPRSVALDSPSRTNKSPRRRASFFSDNE